MSLIIKTGYCAIIILCLFSLFIQKSNPVNNNNNLITKDSIDTLNPGLQKIAEEMLIKAKRKYNSDDGLLMITNAKTGQVIAASEYPQNDDVLLQLSKPWQPGSVIKPLIFAAAIDQGKIKPDDTYYDQGFTIVNDRLINNAVPFEAAQRSYYDVLRLSLNTGAVEILRQLGKDGIDNEARKIWYNYLTKKYRLIDKNHSGNIYGRGYIPRPDVSAEAELIYAQTSFGISMITTPLLLASAYGSLINGGSYCVPSFLDDINCSSIAIDSETSSIVKKTLENIYKSHKPDLNTGKIILGGKTGTSPIALKDGTYKFDHDSGTFIGFLSGSQDQYILLIKLSNPKSTGFASAVSANLWHDTALKIIEAGAIN